MACRETVSEEEKGDNEEEEEEYYATEAQLSAMFPDLEWELLRCVSRAHHGNLELATNYLMAATDDGGSTEHPFSEDIGGLPETLPLSDSDSGSVAEPVTVQLGDSDFSSNEGEALPSYRDVTSDRLHPAADLPPSYDSLLSEGRAGCASVMVTEDAGRSEVTTHTTDSSQNKKQRRLGYKLRARNMKKKGYLTGRDLLD